MARAYIKAELKDRSWLTLLRDSVYSSVNAPRYYKKVNPHITIIPPFKIGDEKLDIVEQSIDKSDLDGKDVHIKSLSVWKNIMEPRVVMLDVDVDLSSSRDMLLNVLGENSATIYSDPVDPHITLMKLYDNMEVFHISRYIKEAIQDQIIDRNPRKETKIEKMTLEVKHKDRVEV